MLRSQENWDQLCNSPLDPQDGPLTVIHEFITYNLQLLHMAGQNAEHKNCGQNPLLVGAPCHPISNWALVAHLAPSKIKITCVESAAACKIYGGQNHHFCQMKSWELNDKGIMVVNNPLIRPAISWGNVALVEGSL